VNSKGEKGLNASFVLFEKAAVEKEFATRAYQSALTTLELARTDAARQHRYLATIAEPSLADEARFPRRYLGTLTVFLACFLAFSIGSLLVATVKEHARL
jgi:capsular polysaccharide transport system permease protein